MITIIEKLLEVIISLFEAGFGLLGETIETLISGVGKRKHAHTSNFISEREVLGRNNTGFCLTGRRSLSAKDSFSNAIVIGGSGSGKSSVVLLPSLYKMEGSFVVFDPSGELYQKSAGYLAAERGYDVKVLNFNNPEISAGYNPLERATDSSGIQKVASMLVEASLGKGKKDPFWNSQATSLLSAVFGVLALGPKQYRNLANARHLLNGMSGEPEGVDKIFERYYTTHPMLWLSYKAFMGMDDKVRTGTIATCLSALTIFGDGRVAQVTANDSISLDDLRKRPTVIFLQTAVADVKYYSVLTSLFLEQCFSYVLSRFPGKDEQDIFFLIDEASSLQFSNLQLSIANCRKHNAGIMLLLQDFRQLIANYGKEEAEAIRANCFAKMYFAGQPLDTAKELEDTLGQFEYKDEDGKTVLRSLMSTSEIITMSSKEALIFCGNRPAIKARLRPYYINSEHRAYSEIQPAVTRGECTATVELLAIKGTAHASRA